ncbi:type II secretion system F family protein [Ferroacidibacillus organovorans]|uniref:Type II secretion system protein GspF domain-containing protein n=1 Tax=Ferroacidibacillus organovorans TaxID=1765683 RepID=A0A101XSP1_9BACL|nr:type II secretion system F family protein [Ferroacidibacillus organovorans]KUO96731.1 hypothetical protein ATW55_07880 [Ferroacidibacillus organovorans]
MHYAYRGMAQDGKILNGRVSAMNQTEAVRMLRDRGIIVLRIRESMHRHVMRFSAVKQVFGTEIRIGKKVNSGEMALFVRQLSALMRAGVILAEAIRILIDQMTNRAFNKALQAIAVEIQKGNQLSQAASEHREIFSPLFINMVRAGEISGTLDIILERLAVFFEKEYYASEKMKSAMTYPLLVGIVSVGVTIFLLVGIIPTFVGMFQNYHMKLPLATRIVLSTSQFLKGEWYVLLIPLLLFSVLYRYAMRKARWRYVRDYVLFRIPVFGELRKKTAMARIGRTLSTLFASAVPVLQSIQLTSDILDNEVIARDLKQCSNRLTRGETLSEPLAESKLFPPMFVHMVRVGEETGNLDSMLSKVADFYESETESMVERLKSLVEPLTVLGLALVVGTIVTSVILPMFSIYQQVGTLQ